MTTYVYQMFKNTDMDEGLGIDVPIPGLFLNEALANEASVGRGVYGSPATVMRVPIFFSMAEFLNWERLSDPDYREYLRLKKRFEN